MKKIMMILALILIIGCTAPTENRTKDDQMPGNGITAKEAYQKMLPDAQKWKSDAGLVQINSQYADKEGKSIQWTAVFYSPSSDEGYMSLYINGRLQANPTPSSGSAHKYHVSGEWIDSDKVTEIAVSKIGNEEKAYHLALSDTPVISGADCRPCWQVMQSEYIMSIKADTGEVIELRDTSVPPQ
ncbi:hypothetical protein JW968_05540 [Candidatus Woesearchaeota archaeon]|nr:hypothetical protein [Candidatus Woesearchaeota archaeon]